MTGRAVPRRSSGVIGLTLLMVSKNWGWLMVVVVVVEVRGREVRTRCHGS